MTLSTLTYWIRSKPAWVKGAVVSAGIGGIWYLALLSLAKYCINLLFRQPVPAVYMQLCNPDLLHVLMFPKYIGGILSWLLHYLLFFDEFRLIWEELLARSFWFEFTLTILSFSIFGAILGFIIGQFKGSSTNRQNIQ